MELEPITRQEQIIAGKDLEPITRMEKFLKEYGGGGGGGASHWNELEGKPFVTVGGDTLEWDGNTEGMTLVDLLGDGSILLAHVSDIAPSYDAVANGFTVSFHDKTEMADMIVPAEDAASMAAKIDGVGYYIGLYNVLVVTEQNEAYSKGVYLNYDLFVSDEAHITYVDAFTVNGYTGFTKEQIDPAVLPTRKFYCDATDMVYLYTDKAFTTKATREEVMEAILNNAIVIAMVHLGAVFATAHIAMANYSGTYATIWAISSISDAGVATYTKLYTAEYTAS